MSWTLPADLKIAGGMALDKIRPNDSRVKSEYLEFEGHRWRTYGVDFTSRFHG